MFFRTSTDRFNYLPLIEIALRLHTLISFFLDDQINQSSEHVEDSMGSSESAEFQKCQPQNFKYPKRKFGSGLDRSLNPSWYKLYPWLHYDVKTDVVLCEVCVSQRKKGNLTLSTKKEDAFISTGFSNWKKTLEKFRKHQESSCHRKTVSMSSIRETNEKLLDMLSNTLSQKKFGNLQILLKILENV